MLFKELAGYYEELEAVSSRLTMVGILSEMFKASELDEIDKIIYMTEGVLAPPFEGVESGVAEKTMIDAIAMATGHSKADVENEYRASGDIGLSAMAASRKSRLKRIAQKQFTVREIYASMRKIATISGVGSKLSKVRLLADMISSSSPAEAKYIARYPLGQLRLGVGDATILEALSLMATGERKSKADLEGAFNICSDLGAVGLVLRKEGMEGIRKFKVSLFKPIRPQLAERLPTAEEIMKRMGGKAAVEQKYDGFRCQVHKKGKTVKIYSRRLEETTQMFPEIIAAAIHDLDAESIIFEGEALAYNDVTGEFLPFQETIQRKRKHGIKAMSESMPLRLFAFDLMYMEGKDYMGIPYSGRRAALERALRNSKTIIPSGRIIATSPGELERFFESSIEEGLEGIVAKDLSSAYTAGARKFSWIKMKRSYKGELSDTVDLVIVGYYLGRGSRAEFGFGGLLCAAYNKSRDVFETVSRIGTGFTEKQLSELKERLEKIRSSGKPVRVDSILKPDFWVEPKYVVVVRADEITRSPTHTCGMRRQGEGMGIGYALRFPRLVGDETIRSDKGAEEATTTEEIVEMFSIQKHLSIAR